MKLLTVRTPKNLKISNTDLIIFSALFPNILTAIGLKTGIATSKLILYDHEVKPAPANMAFPISISTGMLESEVEFPIMLQIRWFSPFLQLYNKAN